MEREGVAQEDGRDGLFWGVRKTHVRETHVSAEHFIDNTPRKLKRSSAFPWEAIPGGVLPPDEYLFFSDFSLTYAYKFPYSGSALTCPTFIALLR